MKVIADGKTLDANVLNARNVFMNSAVAITS